MARSVSRRAGVPPSCPYATGNPVPLTEGPDLICTVQTAPRTLVDTGAGEYFTYFFDPAGPL